MWMNNGFVVKKSSVPSIIIYNQLMIGFTITRKETACDYLKKYNQDYVIVEVDEIAITFISDLKDITVSL